MTAFLRPSLGGETALQTLPSSGLDVMLCYSIGFLKCLHDTSRAVLPSSSPHGPVFVERPSGCRRAPPLGGRAGAGLCGGLRGCFVWLPRAGLRGVARAGRVGRCPVLGGLGSHVPLGRLCRAEGARRCVWWPGVGWWCLRERVHPWWACSPPGARGLALPRAGPPHPMAPRVAQNPASRVCPPAPAAPCRRGRPPGIRAACLHHWPRLRLRRCSGRLPSSRPVEHSPSVC